MTTSLLLCCPAHAATPALSFPELAQRAEKARLDDHLNEATKLYQEGLKLRPAWSDGWWWLGSVYYDQSLYQEARDAFAKYVASSPKPAPGYAFLGLCDYELREYAAARVALTQWLRGGAPGEQQVVNVSRFRWAELLIQDGRYPEALLQLHLAIVASGPTPALAEAMGLGWMRIQHVPEDLPPEDRELVMLAGSAAAYMSADKMDRANEYAARLGKLYGDRANVHFLRGFIDESLKEVDPAAEEYGAELKISPDAVPAMIALSLIDTETGHDQDALALARRVVQLAPENARGHYALGRALLRANDLNASVAELERAQGLAPKETKVHFELAKAYRRLGRTADAKREEAELAKLRQQKEGQFSPEDASSLKPEPPRSTP